MLKKVVALAVTASIAGALVFGCSSSTTEDSSSDAGTTKCKKGQTLSKGKCVTSKTDDTGTDATGDDDDDTGKTDASTNKSDSGPTEAACYDDAAAKAYKAFKLAPVTALLTACTKAQVDKFAADCLVNLQDPDAGARTCLDIAKEVGGNCGTCLAGTPVTDAGTGREGAITANGGPNFYACVNLVGKSTTCGDAVGNANTCINAACESCKTDDGSSTCAQDAFNGGTGACSFGLDQACIDLAYKDTAVDAACRPQLADDTKPTVAEYTAWYVSVSKTFCGYN